jgi:hypothetical protein
MRSFKTNAILIVFWAAAFILQAVLALARAANPEQQIVWLAIRYLILIPASWFPKWYPAHVAAGSRLTEA